GAVEQLPCDRQPVPAVPAQRDDLIDQIARMARTHLAADRSVMAALQVSDHHRMELQIPAAAVQLENANELVDRWIVDLNLVRNTAQKGFIGERGWIQVSREHDQDVEGNLELLAGVQRQIIDPALKRNDPTVQQLFRTNPLPAEIIDEKDAAVCF